MSKQIRFGVIGLGCRGRGITKNVLLKSPDIEVVAVCDLYEDRVEAGKTLVYDRSGKTPFGSRSYTDLLSRDDVDAVYVASSWESHVTIAIEAMKHHKAVAMEVGGAESLDELELLVKTYEETKTPFMMMENCCFNREELLATALVRAGRFGRVVHCSGAYAHDLRDEVTMGNINRHYRLRHYTERNCENYPTHELGPIAKILNINRGNRMVSLVSVASGAFGLREYLNDRPELCEKDPTLKDRIFRQGDIVHTVITCENGETILLKLDTTLPRTYSRELSVRGTKGSYTMDSNSVHLDSMPHGSFNASENFKNMMHNAKAYEEDYLHPVWRDMTDEDKRSGHGGMDGITFKYFVKALKNGEPMPIDVYDAASWMAITALSEKSIAEGNTVQLIPDYTRGKWKDRAPFDVVDFSACGFYQKQKEGKTSGGTT